MHQFNSEMIKLQGRVNLAPEHIVLYLDEESKCKFDNSRYPFHVSYFVEENILNKYSYGHEQLCLILEKGDEKYAFSYLRGRLEQYLHNTFRNYFSLSISSIESLEESFKSLALQKEV